jgi:hypothetical protein
MTTKEKLYLFMIGFWVALAVLSFLGALSFLIAGYYQTIRILGGH